ERNVFMRRLYRDWRPTLLGRWVNRFACWGSGLGLPPRYQATLEVRGRVSGRTRATPVVIGTLDGGQYPGSMLGASAEWGTDVEGAHGEAVIRQGRRRRVHLVLVPPGERAAILREYVRTATSGRKHFPVSRDAPLREFERIAQSYPVYRIEPQTSLE